MFPLSDVSALRSPRFRIRHSRSRGAPVRQREQMEHRTLMRSNNLRVDLFFELSNAACALRHGVLSHTPGNKRKTTRETGDGGDGGASGAAFALLALTRREQPGSEAAQRRGIKGSAQGERAALGQDPPPAEPPRAHRGNPSPTEGARPIKKMSRSLPPFVREVNQI